MVARVAGVHQGRDHLVVDFLHVWVRSLVSLERLISLFSPLSWDVWLVTAWRSVCYDIVQTLDVILGHFFYLSESSTVF